MNEEYPTESEHAYKTQIANILLSYEQNIQPAITNNKFHEEFLGKIESLDFMLADSRTHDIKVEINAQIRFIKPYDPCRLIQDEYITILDDLKSKNTIQKNKQYKLRQKRKEKEAQKS